LANESADLTLSPHLHMSPEEWWDKVEEAFDLDAEFIRSLRLMSKEEAVNRTAPTLFDPEIELEIVHPSLVPYRNTDDREELESRLNFALSAIADLKRMFGSRELSAEFLHLWGAFQSSRGFLESSYFSRGDDLGSVRAGRAGGRPPHLPQKRWVAHLLMRQIQAGRERKLAERDVAAAIWKLLLSPPLPSNFPKQWFTKILGKDDQLKSTYSQNHLSMEEIEQLVQGQRNDIPPIEIPIPFS
jgi:hypothetical protein